MGIYSQNNEDLILLDYFKGQKGTLMSIGENNGKELSNSLALIEAGWDALLVEPSSKVYPYMCGLHLHRDNVHCLNVAVSNFNGKAKFFDSGTHLNKGDNSLLSSLNKSETEKWRKTTEFTEVEVEVVTFEKLLELSPYKTFEFISCDAEGNDLILLQQMNLTKLGCQCICIEHNSVPKVLDEIRSICANYGLTKELLKNAENIILAI